MFRKPVAPPQRTSGTEQSDARNAKEIRRVKHAGVNAEEQVALAHHFKSVDQRKALGVDQAAVKVFQIQLRLLEIHNEDDKTGMARKERGKKILKQMSRPDFLVLGFVVNRQDAHAGGGRLQEIPDTQANS